MRSKKRALSLLLAACLCLSLLPAGALAEGEAGSEEIIEEATFDDEVIEENEEIEYLPDAEGVSNNEDATADTVPALHAEPSAVADASELSGAFNDELFAEASVPITDGEAPTYSGACGENLTWTLSGGVLTISGVGEMYDYAKPRYDYAEGKYSSDSAPWVSGETRFHEGALEKIVVEEGVTSIGTFAFSDLMVKTATLPNSVRSIGDYAFYECYHLSSIVLPEGLTDINEGVFETCLSLKSISLPYGVVAIGANAFRSSGLQHIEFPINLQSIGTDAFRGSYTLESVVINEGVTTIGGGAFADCSSLNQVVIPASVVTMGSAKWGGTEGVFAGDPELKSAGPIGGNYNIQFGWKDSIPDYAFMGMGQIGADGGLEVVTIPSGIVSIGNGAFLGCGSLKKVELPDGLQTVGDRAFYGCTDLSKVIIPGSVSTMGNDIFTWCENLQTVGPIGGGYNIEFGWRDTIPGYAFYSEYIPVDGWEYIPVDARSYITTVILPDELQGIGPGAFSGCVGLTSVNIPEGVTWIGTGAFCNCIGLKSVTIPGSVTVMDGYAFNGCTNLKTAGPIGSGCDIEFGWTIIPEYAFWQSDCVEKIIVPETVTEVQPQAFSDCKSLSKVVFLGQEPCRFSARGSSFYRESFFEGSELLRTAGPIGSGCNIEFDFSYIPECMFYKCGNLTDVIIPEGATKIEETAFRNCTSLTTILIPEGVAGIGHYAFHGCTNLLSIQLPDSLEYISRDAFFNCTGMTDVFYSGSETNWNSIHIHEGNTPLTSATIHYNTGAGGAEIKASGILRQGDGWTLRWQIFTSVLTATGETSLNLKIYLTGTNRTDGVIWTYSDRGDGNIMPWLTEEYGYSKDDFDRIIFSGTSLNMLYIIPSMFSGYSNIKTVMLNYVDGIGGYAFSNCASLTEVNGFDSHLASIGTGAFMNDTKLTSVQYYRRYDNTKSETYGYPDGLVSIGAKAFMNTGLKTLSLYRTVTSIGVDAFADCPALTVYCYKNSYAHEYAEENGLRFSLLEEQSDFEKLLCTDSTQYNNSLALISAELSQASYSVEGRNVRDILYGLDNMK